MGKDASVKPSFDEAVISRRSGAWGSGKRGVPVERRGAWQQWLFYIRFFKPMPHARSRRRL